MTIQITFDVNPTDYGKPDCKTIGYQHSVGIEIANAIYNGFADPPNKAEVSVNPQIEMDGNPSADARGTITFPYTAPETAQ